MQPKSAAIKKARSGGLPHVVTFWF